MQEGRGAVYFTSSGLQCLTVPRWLLRDTLKKTVSKSKWHIVKQQSPINLDYLFLVRYYRLASTWQQSLRLTFVFSQSHFHRCMFTSINENDCESTNHRDLEIKKLSQILIIKLPVLWSASIRKWERYMFKL